MLTLGVAPSSVVKYRTGSFEKKNSLRKTSAPAPSLTATLNQWSQSARDGVNDASVPATAP